MLTTGLGPKVSKSAVKPRFLKKSTACGSVVSSGRATARRAGRDTWAGLELLFVCG